MTFLGLKNDNMGIQGLQSEEIGRVKLSSTVLEKIQLARTEKDLSYAAIAEKGKVLQSTVARFFNGKSINLSCAEAILKSLDFQDLEKLLDKQPNIDIPDEHQKFNAHHEQYSINTAVHELSEDTTDRVQIMASTQLKILDSYHREVLRQVKSSFRWALIISGAGFILFLISTILVLEQEQKDKALIPLISGAMIEIIAGGNFYLYGQKTKQLSSIDRQRDRTQCFLLASIICESLEGEVKQTTRSELVKTVTNFTEEF